MSAMMSLGSVLTNIISYEKERFLLVKLCFFPFILYRWIWIRNPDRRTHMNPDPDPYPCCWGEVYQSVGENIKLWRGEGSIMAVGKNIKWQDGRGTEIRGRISSFRELYTPLLRRSLILMLNNTTLHFYHLSGIVHLKIEYFAQFCIAGFS